MIYFITDKEYVKIGYSARSPESRLRAMQTGNARSLEVVWSMPGGLDEETECHLLFAEYHVRGEWFRYNDSFNRILNSMANDIRQICEDIPNERFCDDGVRYHPEIREYMAKRRAS